MPSQFRIFVSRATAATATAIGIISALVASGDPLYAVETTVTLTPVKDNTLFESPLGRLSNGAGDFLFAGRTNHQLGSPDNPSDRQGLFRRALIQFDIAAALPPGTVVTGALLELYVSNVSLNVPADELETAVAVHRVTTGWGEGASDAIQQEGLGARSEPGDATWIHTHYDGATWGVPGGEYAASASATTPVGEKFQDYQWSAPRLVADVQGWLDDPGSNHGWIVIGDESAPLTAKRFNSRTHPDDDSRPRLVVTCVPDPAQGGALFSVTGVHLGSDGRLFITFPTKEAHTYVVEETSILNLPPPDPWTPVPPGSPIEGTGQPATFEVPGGTGGGARRFLRVVETRTPQP